MYDFFGYQALSAKLDSQHSDLLSLDKKLDSLFGVLKTLFSEVKKMAGELQNLKDKVAQMETVDASTEALLSGLSQLVKDAVASGNPQALTDLANQIDADTQQLKAAVTANTPAAPTPPAPPIPGP